MRQRVLFVCAGNTCRSPMAAELARAKTLSADSAGLECGNGLPAAANAVTVMHERGLDLSMHRSKDVDQVDLGDFDVVVALTPSISKSLARLGPARLVTWNVEDPYGCSVDRYREVADEIERHLIKLCKELK
jgi:protein-tyrosine-phosphatase